MSHTNISWDFFLVVFEFENKVIFAIKNEQFLEPHVVKVDIAFERKTKKRHIRLLFHKFK